MTDDWLNMPDTLTRLDRWVLWRREERDGKITKVPVQWDGARLASSTDPSTWTNWFTIQQAWTRRNGGRPVDGLGFVFVAADGIVGIDLDHCRDPTTGQLTNEAYQIVAALDSYTEASPSGTGVHILVQGTLPPGGRRRTGSVELYNSGRFFTMSCEHLGGTPPDLMPRQAQLDTFYATLFTESSPPDPPPDPPPQPGFAGTDAALLSLARHAPGHELFTALWAGQWEGRYPSQSEADLALCGILAWWCGPDRARIDRLFRQSQLCRDKWTTRDDYRERTLSTCLEGRTHWYGDSNAPPEVVREDPHVRYTDVGNGKRLYYRYGHVLRFCPAWGTFLAWEGTRWATDAQQQVFRWARDTLFALYDEAGALATLAATETDEKRRLPLASRAEGLMRHAIKSEAEPRLKAMVNLSKMDLMIDHALLDADPWALNCCNGTVDLQTGFLRPHQQTDHLTKLIDIAYDPEASCPQWEDFLDTIFHSNQELIAYVQRALGYSLTGDTREQCLFLGYGTGANGKSTFLELARAVAGEYSTQAAFSSFLHTDRDTVRNDLAGLRSSRLVVASESDEGKRLSESVVKSLTGGDTIKARFLYQEYFSFTPSLKLWLGTNHKPTIKGTDYAIWRRIHLIPFTVTIPPEQQDKQLQTRLRTELPGILAWAVRGCQEWLAGGLQPPEAVIAATEAYRTEQNQFEQWLSDCCQCLPHLQTSASDLFNSYQQWTGDKVMTQNMFVRKLSEKGLTRKKNLRRSVVWVGFGLLNDVSENED